MKNMNNIPDFKSSKSAKEFKELGYSYITNVLSKDTCIEFAKDMLFMKAVNILDKENKAMLSAEDTDKVKFNSPYGVGGFPKMENYLKHITKPLGDKLGVKWEPANSYSRIYYNGGMLGEHIDKPSLNYTLSITLLSTINKPWPLYVIDKKGNEVNADIKMGDGLLILGSKMKHWRQPLVCNPDQCVIQLFFHWTNQ